MEKLKCPMCGSTNIQFEARPAGTKSKSNYYRTGIKNSWVLPAGQKTYKSRRNYKTVCLCKNCGHLWDKKSAVSAAVWKLLGWMCFIAVYIAVVVAIFSDNPDTSAYRLTYIAVIIVMSVFAVWKVRKRSE
ncbi:MAG: hypothetical protein ACI4LP_05125 [Anaerovoracaceae bacterium]